MAGDGHTLFVQEIIISNVDIITSEQHAIAVDQLCPSAAEVVRRLQNAGYEAYIVGGSVRDLLLGKAPKDFDVATDATPEQVKEVFPRAHLIGRRFRLAHVRLNGVLIEVATFRGASNQNPDHMDNGRILRDNVWGSLHEDAVRRDFTINALFLDPIGGEIRDFVGGYNDLKERKLKLIGDPVTRYREDPVRLLRAARFVAKLGLQLDAETAGPIAELAHLLEDIPPARMFEETSKLFMTGHAVRTLEALQRFSLTHALLPVLEQQADGKVIAGQVLWDALKSTDRRIAQDKPVTPAFLFAALLWQPVRDRAVHLMSNGMTEFQALEKAGEEILAVQAKRTAVPRRFSAVTRQIWEMQARFRRTRGKRSKTVLFHPRFRAGYDFLLLRVAEDESLQVLADHWTEAQKDMPKVAPQPRRRRPPRKRKRGRKAS